MTPVTSVDTAEGAKARMTDFVLNSTEPVNIQDIPAYEECSICLENFADDNEVVRIKHDNCNHIFGRQCLIDYLKNPILEPKCPLCRTVWYDSPTPSRAGPAIPVGDSQLRAAEAQGVADLPGTAQNARNAPAYTRASVNNGLSRRLIAFPDSMLGVRATSATPVNAAQGVPVNGRSDQHTTLHNTILPFSPNILERAVAQINRESERSRVPRNPFLVSPSPSPEATPALQEVAAQLERTLGDNNQFDTLLRQRAAALIRSERDLIQREAAVIRREQDLLQREERVRQRERTPEFHINVMRTRQLEEMRQLINKHDEELRNARVTNFYL